MQISRARLLTLRAASASIAWHLHQIRGTSTKKLGTSTKCMAPPPNPWHFPQKERHLHQMHGTSTTRWTILQTRWCSKQWMKPKLHKNNKNKKITYFRKVVTIYQQLSLKLYINPSNEIGTCAAQVTQQITLNKLKSVVKQLQSQSCF